MELNNMKPKKCKQCGERFMPEYKTTQVVCSYKCAVIRAGEKLREARFKEIKENVLTISDYYKVLQQKVNHIARLIDKGELCISCRKPSKKENGGHFHAVGGNHSLRFNLHNIFQECHYCNGYKHGNIDNYRKGIIEVYGPNQMEYIDNLKAIYPEMILTKDDVKVCIKTATAIVKELIAKNEVYHPEIRLKLRTKYNEQIGIYL
jgi:hypothetical protein